MLIVLKRQQLKLIPQFNQPIIIAINHAITFFNLQVIFTYKLDAFKEYYNDFDY